MTAIKLTEQTRAELETDIMWEVFRVSDQKIIDLANLLGVKLNLTEKDYEQMPLVKGE